MYSNMACRAAVCVGQGCRYSSSVLMVEKNDSATALSQHCPRRPTDRANPVGGHDAGVLGTGVLPGFNRSLQHRAWSNRSCASRTSAGVFQPRTLPGLLLMAA